MMRQGATERKNNMKKHRNAMRSRRFLSVLLAAATAAALFGGCGSVRTERNEGTLSYEDAQAELTSMMK